MFSASSGYQTYLYPINTIINTNWLVETQLLCPLRITYEEQTIIFRTFFVRVFKTVVDSWKFIMLLLYIVWDEWPIFMISGSNEHLLNELEYTLLKPGCHSWWISKMLSDTLKERYAIKFSFKLGKNATETYGMLQTAFGASCMNRALVFEIQRRQGVCEGWWQVWEE